MPQLSAKVQQGRTSRSQKFGTKPKAYTASNIITTSNTVLSAAEIFVIRKEDKYPVS